MSEHETVPVPRRLVAVNFALLLILAIVTVVGQPWAAAQPGSGAGGSVPARSGRGDFTMLSGRYQGGSSNGVFIVDGANQELVALSWDRTNNVFQVIGYRSLADDARYLQQPR